MNKIAKLSEVLNHTQKKHWALWSLSAASTPALALQMLFTPFQGWPLIRMSQKMHRLHPDKEDTVAFIQHIWSPDQRMPNVVIFIKIITYQKLHGIFYILSRDIFS